MRCPRCPTTRLNFWTTDDHSLFLARMRDDTPDFVLNFCDTDYRNINVLGLNIVAHLELLSIPYSGATPQAVVVAYDKALV